MVIRIASDVSVFGRASPSITRNTIDLGTGPAEAAVAGSESTGSIAAELSDCDTVT